jgi:hypothetical protein
MMSMLMVWFDGDGDGDDNDSDGDAAGTKVYPAWPRLAA